MNPLKVTLISHSDTMGGASVVTFRLMQALRRAGVDARMIVFVKNSDDPNIDTASKRNCRTMNFLIERAHIFLHNGFSRENLFKVSEANTGVNLCCHPWIKDTDIIALNWVNQGMLSLKDIYSLSQLGKPIVWTMHDMWCLTGICHHAYECTNYRNNCGNCQYLHNGTSSNDLSRKTWAKKNWLYENSSIHFIAVSNWLAEKCRESSLLGDKNVSVIPNAFPITSFMTRPTATVRSFNLDYSKNIILMGAARLDDPIKGIGYAIDAFNYIFDNHPDVANNCTVVLFGDIRDSSLLKNIRLHYRHLGRINDPDMIRQLYASSKIVVSTSLYETLPGTLIEGQAAGCVPVSFGHGGQNDIIDHKVNGYIAEYKSAKSIAEGIIWALENAPDRQFLHRSVHDRFASDIIAQRYISLFNSLLQNR
ncbi:MAG: glycosyltransferase [Muribaculaceae bacterium]|nr:glycosyltransferase [Muribaculaceae bacterium]